MLRIHNFLAHAREIVGHRPFPPSASLVRVWSRCSFSRPSSRAVIRKSLAASLHSMRWSVTSASSLARSMFRHLVREIWDNLLRGPLLHLPPPLASPPSATALPVSRSSSLRRSSARLLRISAISSRSLHSASFERVVREDFFGSMSSPQVKACLSSAYLNSFVHKFNGSGRNSEWFNWWLP